jgi:thymidine phosphorylase
VVEPFRAPRSGWIAALDAREVGLASVELGAGRSRVGQAIDPAVGFEVEARPGDRVEEGQPLVRVHAADEGDLEGARRRLERAVRITDEPEDGEPVAWERARIRWRITAEGATRLDGGG